MEKIRTSVVLPSDLKEKIKEEADKQGRSPHNLMLFILRSYFENKESQTDK